MIKTFEIQGKNYDIKKKGVSVALRLKSVFMKIIINSGMPIDQELSHFQYIQAQMAGIDDGIEERLKRIIIEVVEAPALTEESYEALEHDVVMEIFNSAYDFYFAKAEDKKKGQQTSSEEGEQVPTLKI